MKWHYSTDEAVWNTADGLESRQDAVETARQELEPGQTFFTGSSGDPMELSCVFDWDQIQETVYGRLYDEVADAADLWDARPSAEQQTELEDALERTLLEWMGRHGMTPEVFVINDVESHVVPLG